MASSVDRPLSNLRWSPEHGFEPSARRVPEETAVAIVHDGSTTAVMMATPADLEDFALGFSLSEGIIAARDEIREIEVAETDLGVELRIWLVAGVAADLARRRRARAGPTGCGLCGVDSLAEAVRPPRRIESSAPMVDPEDLIAALEELAARQTLGNATRAVHAAGLWRPPGPRGGLVAVREDVGRHNALDKLIGATLADDLRSSSVLLLTSRVSVEMIQKAAVLGAPILCAVSAPTALAVRTAEAANLTLVGVARADGLEVFAGPERLRA